jgi:hypothetical protein
MGELGWTIERWRSSTFTEFNYAAEGYWRNWERQTAWLMRELVYAQIQGNPYIKNEDKPRRSRDIFKTSDDKDETVNIEKPPEVTEQDLRVMEALNFKAGGTAK